MSDTDLILTELQKLREVVGENTVPRQEFESLIATVRHHDQFIHGNGKLGAETRLTLLEKTVSDVGASLKKEIEAAINAAAVRIATLIAVPLLIMGVAWLINTVVKAAQIVK